MTGREWTKAEIKLLKQAVKDIGVEAYPDKNERFKAIASLVGGGRGKTECYGKYKELKAAKKVALRAAAAVADGSSCGGTTASAKSSERGRLEVAESGEVDEPPRAESEGSFAFTKAPAQVGGERNSQQLFGSTKGCAEARQRECGAGTTEDIVISDVLEDDIDFAECEETVTTSVSTKLKKNLRLGEIQHSTRHYDPGSHLLGNIALDDALSMRKLLFGDAQKSFSESWTGQNFTFSKVSGLEYGLVQRKGGPCGVLAAVQAYVLDFLYHRNGTSAHSHANGSQLSPSTQREMLEEALIEILWTCGRKTLSKILVPADEAVIVHSSSFKWDGITERLQIYSVASRNELKELLHCFLPHFRKSGGVVLLTYSCIMSRGLKETERDMDSSMCEGPPQLMGRYDYAGQELVNLLLIGEARSNVFDGQQALGDLVLHGVGFRSRIGFLTLFEHYGHTLVGRNYKDPEVPIWVICSESHFSVLFSAESESPPGSDSIGGPFDLFYYDGLANQDEVIRLTIFPSGKPPTEGALSNQIDEGDLTPPLDLVIGTKWTGARIEWNGTDPIL